jgi:CheY-specific phosphatase CheX
VRRAEWERTNEAVLVATNAVFGHTNTTLTYVRRASELPRGWSKVAIIGFSGEALRGMLALRVDRRLLERTFPVSDASCATDDWLCELANLVLGRFKGELLRLGITVHLSTPMLVEGTDVSLDTSAVSVVVHELSTERGEDVHVVLDAIAESSAQISETNAATVTSGDVLLFEGV